MSVALHYSNCLAKEIVQDDEQVVKDHHNEEHDGVSAHCEALYWVLHQAAEAYQGAHKDVESGFVPKVLLVYQPVIPLRLQHNED